MLNPGSSFETARSLLSFHFFRPCWSSTFEDHLRDCVLVCVTQADPPDLGAELTGNLQGLSSQDKPGFAVELIYNFHILPTHPFPPTGANGFEGCFFGRETSRVMLELSDTSFTVLDFSCRKGPVTQTVSPSDHRQPELFDFDDIHTNTDNQLRHPRLYGH